MTLENREHYFDTLGVKPSASPEEIIRAYQALMEYWNPDRVPDFYKQKAMEGRDKVEEAYQELMGLRKKDQKEEHRLEQKAQEFKKKEQSVAEAERVLIGEDRDGTLFYLDKMSIVFNKDKAEVAVNIYLPEGSSRLNTARGYVRRSGHEGFECVMEKWGIGLSNGVFIKYGQYYKSTSGHLIETTEAFRKIWKPIVPGTLEEVAWKMIDGMLHKEKVA
jgi:hypothetical protein